MESIFTEFPGELMWQEAIELACARVPQSMKKDIHTYHFAIIL